MCQEHQGPHSVGKRSGLGNARPCVLSGCSREASQHRRRAGRARDSDLDEESQTASEPVDSRMQTLEHFLTSSSHFVIVGFCGPQETFMILRTEHRMREETDDFGMYQGASLLWAKVASSRVFRSSLCQKPSWSRS